VSVRWAWLAKPSSAARPARSRSPRRRRCSASARRSWTRYARAVVPVSCRNSRIRWYDETPTAAASVLEPYVITSPVFVRLGERSGLVGGETVMRGKEKGEAFAEHFRYADTFVWRDGRWQVVYIQVTMLPPVP
jgi:hypothetical protein